MMWRTLLAAASVGICMFAIAPEGARAQDPGQATVVNGIKGKKLLLYDGPKGKVVGRRDAGTVPVPMPIKAVSKNGRYLVEIDNTDYWIVKAQAKTDAGAPGITAKCQTITKSFASSRGFGNCK